jgi:RNA polymerase sigma-70 factor (ECF subfamily)
MGIFEEQLGIGKGQNFCYVGAKLITDFMEPDEGGPGASGRFNTTHWSVVLSAGKVHSPQTAEALEKLCRAYWQPLYFFARRKGRNDADAKDVTQQFFSMLLQRNDFAGLDPGQGRFRTFLLVSFTNFLANDYDRANALKRGGGQTLVSLDALSEDQIGQFENSPNALPGPAFDRHWATSVLVQALARLKLEFSACQKSLQFDLLKPYLTAEGVAADYAGMAEKLGVAPSSVPVLVHRFRQRYRELVREEVAQTLSSPADLEAEMWHLFEVLNS